MNWSRAFAKPFVLADGSKIKTLYEAGQLVLALPERHRASGHWQGAMEQLMAIVSGEHRLCHLAGHAKNIFEASRVIPVFPETPGKHKDIIAQTDGGMVPIVEPDAGQKDKRKGKTLSWREAKISLAHAKGSTTPVYAGAIEGGVETAGRQLLECAVRAGFGANSRVHAVGDGAPWIVGQVEEQFGAQGSYLIDFYHVCEYL